MTLGFRVVTHVNRPPADLVERFIGIRSCDLSDVMNQAGTMVGIRPAFTPVGPMVGTAVTVSVPAGGINMVKMGIEQAMFGDVLVVSAQEDTTYAMIGGNIALGMQARGLKGFVIDGAVRDVSELRALQFPVFCRGVACAAADLGGPRGEVNVPIACGSVVVSPGDIVVGDEDGVVVVPTSYAEAVLKALPDLKATHARAREVLKTGAVTSIDWITKAFLDKGLEIVEAVSAHGHQEGGVEKDIK